MSTPLADMQEAARHASEILRRRRLAFDGVYIEEKTRHDFVTSVDREAEDAIVAFLERRWPGIPFLAEESAHRKATASERWIIDPLDGTTNYIHDYPCFAVSIAFESGGRIAAGVVLDPVRDEMFTVDAGGGARLNDRPIRVSSANRLGASLLVTGFPFKMLQRLDEYLAGFRLLVQRAAGIRRDGSAALDLCYVACGRCDGFWEMGLSPWDVAAGGLLVTEAGGLVTDFAGGPDWLTGQRIVAAAPGVHPLILDTLREAAAA